MQQAKRVDSYSQASQMAWHWKELEFINMHQNGNNNIFNNKYKGEKSVN